MVIFLRHKLNSWIKGDTDNIGARHSCGFLGLSIYSISGEGTKNRTYRKN